MTVVNYHAWRQAQNFFLNKKREEEGSNNWRKTGKDLEISQTLLRNCDFQVFVRIYIVRIINQSQLSANEIRIK